MTRDSQYRPASDQVVATCEGGVEIGLGFDLTLNAGNHSSYGLLAGYSFFFATR